jgi:hypothetical protein
MTVRQVAGEGNGLRMAVRTQTGGEGSVGVTQIWGVGRWAVAVHRLRLIREAGREIGGGEVVDGEGVISGGVPKGKIVVGGKVEGEGMVVSIEVKGVGVVVGERGVVGMGGLLYQVGLMRLCGTDHTEHMRPCGTVNSAEKREHGVSAVDAPCGTDVTVRTLNTHRRHAKYYRELGKPLGILWLDNRQAPFGPPFVGDKSKLSFVGD